MIDLYKAYGLNPYEKDSGKIKKAISIPPFAYKGAVEYVLLHKDRKSIYDRTHETLSLIGEVRGSLDLNNTAYWGGKYEDFYRVSKKSYKYNQNQNANNRTKAKKKSKEAEPLRPQKPVRFVKGDIYIAAIIVVILLSFFLSDNSNTESKYSKAGNTSPNNSKPISNSSSKPKQIMHVTAKALNVREQPNANAKIVGRFKQYQDVYKIRNANESWALVRSKDSKIAGYVSNRYIDKGNGATAWTNECRAKGISRPRNGELMGGSKYGNHALVVQNSPGNDALVKLKSSSGKAVITMYVRAGQTARAKVPEGRYQFQYASGEEFSPSCGRFLVNMVASKDPNYTDYLAERRYDGIAYVEQTYTLRRVSSGNFRPSSMSAIDF